MFKIEIHYGFFLTNGRFSAEVLSKNSILFLNARASSQKFYVTAHAYAEKCYSLIFEEICVLTIGLKVSREWEKLVLCFTC